MIIEHRRQVRKEIRKTIRRRFVGRVVAGIVLGTVIRVAVAGRPPAPPSPDLCWFWSNSSRRDGYWYYCSGD